MFVIFSKYKIPYYTTDNEMEADTVSYYIGGYYIESGAY